MNLNFSSTICEKRLWQPEELCFFSPELERLGPKIALYVIHKGHNINWGHHIDFVCSIIKMNIFTIYAINEISFVYNFPDAESAFMFHISIEMVKSTVYIQRISMK